jgi:hypothetical protein
MKQNPYKLADVDQLVKKFPTETTRALPYSLELALNVA